MIKNVLEKVVQCAGVFPNIAPSDKQSQVCIAFELENAHRITMKMFSGMEAYGTYRNGLSHNQMFTQLQSNSKKMMFVSIFFHFKQIVNMNSKYIWCLDICLLRKIEHTDGWLWWQQITWKYKRRQIDTCSTKQCTFPTHIDILEEKKINYFDENIAME